jgi:hypothetical protein
MRCHCLILEFFFPKQAGNFNMKTQDCADLEKLEKIDLLPYEQGNTGISYLHRFDSGYPGPHVMITALVHGNEVCGAIALDHLMRSGVRPGKGVLSLCFVNVDAYALFSYDDPRASRFVDEDLNRVWSGDVLDSSRDSTEIRRSRELRGYVETVDYLLDIHSMDSGDKPLVLSGPLEKGIELARKVGYPEMVVADAGHKGGQRLRDYGEFSDPNSHKNALLVECGPHWQRGTERVAIDMCYRFLRAIDRPAQTWEATRQRVVEVREAITMESEEFAFTENFQGFEVIPKAGTTIAWDGQRAIRTPHDDCVLIMPVAKPKRNTTVVRLGREIQ